MLKKFNKKKTWMIPFINKAFGIFYHEKKAAIQLDLNKIRNILIIDYALIGDAVMSSSFFRIIRNNIPNAQITLVCSGIERTIYEEQNLIDEFVTIDFKLFTETAGIVRNNCKIRQIAKRINKNKYDLAIEPRGDLRFIYLMHLCNAKRKVSYSYTGGECFLTDVIRPSGDVNHLVEDKMYFIKSLGCIFSDEDIYPRLYINQEQELIRKKFVKQNNLEGKTIIGIHPGASLAVKEWGGFHKVLLQLNKSRFNPVFILFEGPNEKKAVIKLENAALSCGARYIISNTSIEEYMLRISLCDVMICNDSGAGHIAAAYGVPSFVVFGPVLPETARPYAKDNVYCFSEELSCKPCMATVYDNSNECLKKIKPDDVSEKVLTYFNNRGC